MSLSWSISHPSRLIRIVAKVELHQAAFVDLLQSIDTAKASSYQKLVDITGLMRPAPTRMLRELAAIVRNREIERTVGPIALIANTPAQRHQADTFCKDAEGNRLVRTFATQHEAQRWLGSFYSFENKMRMRASSKRLELTASVTGRSS